MTKRPRSTSNGGTAHPAVARGGSTPARKIARNLSALIDDAQTNERDLKVFFDAYPGALPTPWLLNHGVHFDFIFPEYEIGTRFKCDYMFLTKSSGEWRCVLIEIESPHAKLFRTGGKDIKTRSALNVGLDQIRDWREYLLKNRDAFLRDLEPILLPFSMARNPLSFKYALVIGRTAEYKNDPRKAERLSTLNANADTWIMTYDSALSAFRQEHLRLSYSDRNLLVAHGGRFRFKRYVPSRWQSFWWYLRPAQLELTPEQLELAERAGMPVKHWLAGRELPSPPIELSEISPDLVPSSK
jgi:hypothetical protein